MRGIFLGLGSNCGECSRLLRDAVALLEERGVVVVAKSSIYETEAVWGSERCGLPDYLNAVVEVETDLSVQDLLCACDEVERALGRVRGSENGEVRWGARTIDIDILLYGQEVVGWGASALARESDSCRRNHFFDNLSCPADTLHELVVPHPRMHERNFVLVPLVEVIRRGFTDVIHPVFGVSIIELLRNSQDKHRVVVSREEW